MSDTDFINEIADLKKENERLEEEIKVVHMGLDTLKASRNIKGNVLSIMGRVNYLLYKHK